MASSKLSNPNVRYIVTEDSAPAPKAMYKKPIVKAVTFFIVLGAVSVVSLYSLGFDPTAAETIEEEGLGALQLDGATDALCLSYTYVVESCSDVSIAQIAATGCMYYVEATGGVCVCFDDSKTSCVVNTDCDLVDTSSLSTTNLADATDALCLSYEYVVDSCSDISVEEIAATGCMYYVEATGGVCVCLDDSKTSCVVNSDCDLVDTAGLSATNLADSTDALCLSYMYVVNSCSDVSAAEIAETGCMFYVEATGGICVCLDDSKTSCIVNSDCDIVDTSELSTIDLWDAADALCMSYKYVVDSCSDVSIIEIAENGCMYYVEATGGICRCLDATKTSCIVNTQCDLVDTSVLSTTNLDDATDALCLSYKYVVNSCADVSVNQITEIGCMYYVEATGGICVCLDDSKTSCIVNSDCDLVDTSALYTTHFDDATDALCLSYEYVVNSCSDVLAEEIAATGCMYYVEATGGVCVCLDDSKTSCIVNPDCGLVDTSAISTINLADATDALCLSYKYVIESCSDVTIAEIDAIGCMYYVEAAGGICVCLDDSKTSCIVNSDCDLVDTSGLSSELATIIFDDNSGSDCSSYQYVVDSCSDVMSTEIAETGCMYYVEAAGGICVNKDDSKTSCVANVECDLVDTSGLTSDNIAEAIDEI